MKENRTIMKTKPEVTDEEIRGFMNFDKLVSESHAIDLKRKNISRLIWGILTVALIGGSAVYLFIPEHEISKDLPKTEMTLPAISPNDVEEIENKNQTAEEKPEVKAPEKNKKNLGSVQEREPETKIAGVNDSAVSTTSVYIEAEPVEGFPHLYEYFNTELTYPKEAVKDSIQGIVTVSFVIGKEGKPEEVKIIHSLGALFDQEVYRLIEQMPAWKPATMNGKPMRAKISLPLTFRMEKVK